jgi:lipoyl(octanoyl) transferase
VPDCQLLHVKKLGLQPYEVTWQAMKDFTNSRNEDTVDNCWFVEHPAVFTLGQAGKAEHILYSSQIPVVKSDRGGQVTYHGPGQLVLYFLVNLKRRHCTVRDFVSVMEASVIKTLATYGVDAELKDGAPGVYVAGAKIASLGLRVRKGCTYHGLSLNVDMDLSPFGQINPCGYEGLAIAQLSQLSSLPVVMPEVQHTLLQMFAELLHYQIEVISE